MKKNYGASGFVRAPDVLGATAEEVQDSLREDVALAFKLCNQQAATITALEARLKALEVAAQDLIVTMETCHDCRGLICLDEHPVHCEDCHYDCECHEGEECVPTYELHRRVKVLLAPAAQPSAEGTEAGQAQEAKQ